MKEINCRGLNCPEPVLRTKSALSEDPAASLIVIVDNQIARDNVLRFARSKGREANWQEKEGVYHITITAAESPSSKASKTDTSDPCLPAADPDKAGKPVLFISTDQLGVGSSELGKMLMRNFIYTLTKRDQLPEAIVLMNSGVNLSTKDSPVIEELEELINNGVLILVCGTCVDYFELKDRHKAGQISNMYDISDLLLAANRVVTI